MKNNQQQEIKPGNLVFAKKSLKMYQSNLNSLSLGYESFDDFFDEEYKRQKINVSMVSTKKDALTFLKTKKYSYYYNNQDPIIIYKHYFLDGTNIVYISTDNIFHCVEFNDIFELAS